MALRVIPGAVTPREERTERAGALCSLCGRNFRTSGTLIEVAMCRLLVVRLARRT